MTYTEKCRLDILNYSLTLEMSASFVLGYIFDRQDYEDTKSFGNKSTSLSFNQKILLLIDYGSIEKDEKAILDGVMNIRNQFLHNGNCKSYRDAFKSIDGLENKFRKLFKENFNNEKDVEQNLEKSVADAYVFSMDVFRAITQKGGVKNKMWMKSERDTYKFHLQKICENGMFELLAFRNDIENDGFDYRNKSLLLEKFDELSEKMFKVREEDTKESIANTTLF